MNLLVLSSFEAHKKGLFCSPGGYHQEIPVYSECKSLRCILEEEAFSDRFYKQEVDLDNQRIAAFSELIEIVKMI